MRFYVPSRPVVLMVVVVAWWFALPGLFAFVAASELSPEFTDLFDYPVSIEHVQLGAVCYAFLAAAVVIYRAIRASVTTGRAQARHDSAAQLYRDLIACLRRRR